MKKVCIVTGSRAEYGLLKWVIEAIEESKCFKMQLVLTGMHLSPEFGLTSRAIEGDGFVISRRVEMLLSSDTGVGVSKSLGLGVIGFADVFDDLRPDFLLILGDRFEIFASAISAMIQQIPVLHLHGGEKTKGAIDDSIRHAITKLAHFHFVATDEYRDRVVQLGEDPRRVFVVGGLGVDGINRIPLLSRQDLEIELGFSLRQKNLLVTFHPVTLQESKNVQQFEELLCVLDEFEDLGIVFTLPNADMKGRELGKKVRAFCDVHPNAICFASLGQLKYLSCMKHFDGVVGNSSSAILEAPSMKKGAVNIGDRQEGRIKAESVIDCEPNSKAIRSAIMHLLSEDFKSKLCNVKSPYGSGGASKNIVSILEEVLTKPVALKEFYDLPNDLMNVKKKWN